MAQASARGEAEPPAKHVVARVEEPIGAVRDDTPAGLAEQGRPAMSAEMPDFGECVADLAVVAASGLIVYGASLAMAFRAGVWRTPRAQTRPAAPKAG